MVLPRRRRGTSWTAIPGATSDTLTIPDVTAADAGGYRATFTESDGPNDSWTTNSEGASLNVEAPAIPPPTVTGITPSSGPAGPAIVIIFGTGFSRVRSVAFGAVKARVYLVLTRRVILALVPSASAGTVDVTVAGPGGTSATSSADHYTYG